MNTTSLTATGWLRAQGRLLVLTATILLSMLLTVGPAAATEGEQIKTSLPQTQHDRVGLIILAITALAALGGLANARRQLKGERDQASGEFRWR
jgi:hypothetical protein